MEAPTHTYTHTCTHILTYRERERERGKERERERERGDERNHVSSATKWSLRNNDISNTLNLAQDRRLVRGKINHCARPSRKSVPY